MNDDRQPQRPLSNSEVERYSRQVIVPGVGATGQAKLITATVAVAGNRLGVDQASRYLTAAGLRIIPATGDDDTDCYVFAGIDEVPDATRSVVLASQAPLAWYVIEGATILSGSNCASARDHYGEVPHPQPAPSPGPEFHAVAACDAAAVAIALVLGWEELVGSTEIDLA